MTRETVSIEGLLNTIRSLAGELKKTPASQPLHDELQQLLSDWQFSRARVDHGFSIRLSYFLGSLQGRNLDIDIAELVEQLTGVGASGASTGMTMIVHPPEPAAAPRQPHPWSQKKPATPESQSRRPTAPRRAARPVIPKTDPVRDEEYVPLDRAPESRASPDQRSARVARSVDKDPSNDEADDKRAYPEVERRVNSTYRQHLDRKHGEIEKLQELLAQKATEAMAQNKAFGALLETERAALDSASTVSDIDAMKQILIGGTEELLAGQRDLADKLSSSFEYLRLIKDDSEKLHDELNKVKLLSLTDENTGLPNRRAFIRRLDDEIARADSYEQPLSLALIDLDFFKDINDTYGHPAGDAVLTWYAREGLPIFRHYDMVARWGGEEFAVLFPGTAIDGAERALAKLHKHVRGAFINYDDVEIEIPSFSAGLTCVRGGDTDESLIKRADQALYLAKNKGRDRIVTDTDAQFTSANQQQ